jgi:tRNA threonylcarbamoyladenosine biosynthesis protein TsaB
MILAIRTDKPEAEVYLLDASGKVVASETWLADRRLSQELLPHLESLLNSTGGALQDVQGVVVWQGPGSFTGLRIGMTVANALAYGLVIPVVGATGDTWLGEGVSRLLGSTGATNGDSTRRLQIVLPEYGSEPHTTKPRK